VGELWCKTSTFAQHKLVQKTIIATHSRLFTRWNSTVYTRKRRLKYLEHVLNKKHVHNNGAEWQQSSWQSRRHENLFLRLY